MQDAVASILIGEKTVGLYFGYPCVQIYAEACIDNPDYMNLESGSGSAALLESAHRNHCLIERIKPVVTFKEIYQWVEAKIMNGQSSELSGILDQWSACSITKDALDKIQKKTEEMKAVSPQT